MNHNLSRILMYVSWLVGVVPMSFGIVQRWWWLVVIAGIVVLGGYIQACIFCRCAHCGRNLMKKVLGQKYCPYCGEPLD